jgi:ankyrin repeat protein
VKWFLEHGADPSLNDDGLSSPLDSAACKGTTTTISLLLKHGAKLDESNALQAAAIGSLGIPMMEYLLDCGFDINAFDVSKKPVLTRGGIGTALHMAAKEGYKDRVQFLLERGALRDIKREDKVCSMTPAEWAKRHGKMEIYEMLSKSTGAASVRRHSLQR